MIKNKKIQRFKIDSDHATENFDRIDAYLDDIKKFIYTDINILYEDDDPRVIQSRVQHLVSSTLIRSLLLKEGIVDALNNDNVAATFAIVKSFMETAGVLGYLYDLFEKNLSDAELLPKLVPLAAGNKDAGELSVTAGTDAINVKTMFSKLDRHMANLQREAAQREYASGPQLHVTMLSDMYGVICNYDHPNYSAHELAGDLATDGDSEGIWRATTIEEIGKQKKILWGGYMPGFQVTLSLIPYLAQKIYDHPKMKDAKVSSRLYWTT